MVIGDGPNLYAYTIYHLYSFLVYIIQNFYFIIFQAGEAFYATAGTIVHGVHKDSKDAISVKIL